MPGHLGEHEHQVDAPVFDGDLLGDAHVEFVLGADPQRLRVRRDVHVEAEQHAEVAAEALPDPLGAALGGAGVGEEEDPQVVLPVG